MDLDARIRRRQRRSDGPRLVENAAALSPVAHVDEPVGRGPTLEGLLDILDPVFDANLPPDAYLHGPAGAGKSALVTALVDRLERLSNETASVVHTTTRGGSPPSPGFVHVDCRTADTDFALHHAVLDALVDEAVPTEGVGTDALRERLAERLADGGGVVVALDHVDDPDGPTPATLRDRVGGLPPNCSWLAVGRTPPSDNALAAGAERTLAIDAYRPAELVDVVLTRASMGLAQGGLSHGLARRLAEWADGDAHDALAALFVAVGHARSAGRTRIDAADVDAAIASVPEDGVSLARVLALPANKRRVLAALVERADDDSATITETAERVADAVDLSPSTVTRYLYEMAESGILRRVTAPEAAGEGRPPSRVEPRFSVAAFRRLNEDGT